MADLGLSPALAVSVDGGRDLAATDRLPGPRSRRAVGHGTPRLTRPQGRPGRGRSLDHARAHPRRSGRDRAARPRPRFRRSLAGRDGAAGRSLPAAAAADPARADRGGLRRARPGSPGTIRRTAIRRSPGSRVRRELMPALATALGPGVAGGAGQDARTCCGPTRTCSTPSRPPKRTGSAAPSAGPDGRAGRLTLSARCRRRSGTASCAARRWLQAARPAPLAQRHVASLDELVTGWHGQRWADLPGGIRCQRRYGRLLFTRAGVRGCSPARPRRDRRTRVDANDMGADLKEVLITPEQLHQRIGELAAQIDC